MALHYLIDGYNLIYALREIPAGSLREKRETFLRQLVLENPHGKNRLSVIFDSREGLGNKIKHGEIDTHYTAGETADDWISRYVRRAANPRILVVVTNDQGLRRMVRGTGAKSIGAEEFWRQVKNPVHPVERRTSHPEADRITEEFKKRWL